MAEGAPGGGWAAAAPRQTPLMRASSAGLVRGEGVPREAATRLPPYDVYPQPTDLVPASGGLSDASRSNPNDGQRLLTAAVDGLVACLSAVFANNHKPPQG